MITVSFPGINIGEFSINSTAFTVFGVEIQWYGLIVVTGIILALLYCAYRAKYEGIALIDLFDMALLGIILSVIGARLFYVLMTLSEYHSFYDVIAIWNGGLAIYGALITGALTVYLVCRKKKIKYTKAFDMISPALMIGQAVGRWGNFFNGEAYGRVVDEESIFYFIRMGIFPHEIEGVNGIAYVHPTFLYESLWNIIGFVMINALYKKKKFDGQIFLMYITWYGFGRMLIEGLRTDSLYLGVFRISQVIAFVCVVLGAILLIYNLSKNRRAELTAKDYEPAYPNFSHMPSRAFNVTEDSDDDDDDDDDDEIDDSPTENKNNE